MAETLNKRLGAKLDKESRENARRYWDRKTNGTATLRALPGYPWLDPCPRCGYRGSCDCSVLERARTAHPGLNLNDDGVAQ